MSDHEAGTSTCEEYCQDFSGTGRSDSENEDEISHRARFICQHAYEITSGRREPEGEDETPILDRSVQELPQHRPIITEDWVLSSNSGDPIDITPTALAAAGDVVYTPSAAGAGSASTPEWHAINPGGVAPVTADELGSSLNTEESQTESWTLEGTASGILPAESTTTDPSGDGTEPVYARPLSATTTNAEPSVTTNQDHSPTSPADSSPAAEEDPYEPADPTAAPSSSEPDKPKPKFG